MAITGRRVGETLLKVENITMRFGGVKALTDISLEVKQHEILAIIGPNGAGKSSMLNVINGVYHPQEGKITYKGEVRSKMQAHQAAAQVLPEQQHQSLPARTRS